ncbi:hypothetical protein BJ165DRAFT_1515951 [Panaeolus papilionaceus]|nr:hypothetical protein BJ165DRAFT_1515951 [Panaeolus papilionaceus]
MSSPALQLITMFPFTFTYTISALSVVGLTWGFLNLSSTQDRDSLGQIKETDNSNTSIRPLERQRALDAEGFAQMNLAPSKRKFKYLQSNDLFGLGCDGPVRPNKRARLDEGCSEECHARAIKKFRRALKRRSEDGQYRSQQVHTGSCVTRRSNVEQRRTLRITKVDIQQAETRYMARRVKAARRCMHSA